MKITEKSNDCYWVLVAKKQDPDLESYHSFVEDSWTTYIDLSGSKRKRKLWTSEIDEYTAAYFTKDEAIKRIIKLRQNSNYFEELEAIKATCIETRETEIKLPWDKE